jgi:protein phosphatase 1 regulatory subunit 7
LTLSIIILTNRPPQNLEFVDYSFNLIENIEKVDTNKYLKIILLRNNRIIKIENLKNVNYLEELDLSYNQIEVIENLDHLNLRKLNLMNNCIRNISGLDNLKTLVELNLSKNSISRLKGLQNLFSLRYLYVSSNQLSRAKQVAYISELPFLTDVDFCFNDVQNRKYYRFQVNYLLILDLVLSTQAQDSRWTGSQ